MESSGFKSNGGSLLKMKEFEQEYRDQGAYHHRLEGFSKWWMFDNYPILASWVEKEGRTLDLACGDGMIWRFFKTYDIVGVDHPDLTYESIPDGAAKILSVRDIVDRFLNDHARIHE